jgi:hypothetical protein
MRQNNKWRRRIIRVLETLLKDLHSRPPSPTQAKVINKLAALSDRGDNIMDGLGKNGIAEALYYTRSIPIPKTDDCVLYKLKDSMEDKAFFVYCCMQDATYLRLYSVRAWREFALSNIGVQTATFCTNSAIAQFEEMAEQLDRVFDHNKEDGWVTHMHVKTDQFMRRYIANDVECEDSHPDGIDPAFEDDSLARHAARKLGFYASTLQCSRLSTLLFEAFVAREHPDPADTLEEKCLLKSLAQLRCLERTDDPVSKILKSDYMYGATRTLLSGCITTTAVFAAQMLYDIQQETKPQDHPLEDILELLTIDYLILYDRYTAEWKNEGSGGNCSTRFKQMMQQYSLLNDIVYSDSNVQVNLEQWEHDTPRQYTIQDFNIVRHVPTLIGQMLFQYHNEFHGAFTDIANDRGHVLTAIHLYNAAKKSGSLPQEACWADMERVIDSQVELDLFGSSVADTGSKYLDSFCNAYGLIGGKFTFSHKLTSPEQIRNDIHQAGGSPKRLGYASKYAKACYELSRTLMAEPVDFKLRLMRAFAGYQLDTSSVYGSPHCISVLIAAKEQCEGDEEALGFDIFAIHMTCKRLLSSIRRACLEYAPNDYPGIRYDGTEGLNTTIAELLRDLLDCPRHHGRMWPMAMTILADVISQEGSACEEKAFQRRDMTTMDSISEESESDTPVDDTPVDDTPVESDNHESDIVISETLTSRSSEYVGDLHPPSKKQKLDSAGASSQVVPELPEEWNVLQQRDVRILSNLTVDKESNELHYLITPGGKILASWSPEETWQAEG